MRIAERNPAYCSSCYGQYVDKKHIDFEAAWDGPVVNPKEAIKVAIDDLVLCEGCVREAAKLLGMTDSDEAEKVLRYKASLMRESKARKALEDKLATIQGALA